LYLEFDKHLKLIQHNNNKTKDPFSCFEDEKESSCICYGSIFNNKNSAANVLLNSYLKNSKDTEFSEHSGNFNACLILKNKLVLVTSKTATNRLYFKKTKNGLVLSSEIKRFTAPLEILPYEKCEEKYWRENPTRTFFKNIQQLPPGSYVVINSDLSFDIHFYHKVSNSKLTGSLEDSVRETRMFVERAVARVSSKKCSSLLSGGVDSSIISLILAREGQLKKAYSIGSNDNNEFKEARKVADFLNVELVLLNYNTEHILDFWIESIIKLEHGFSEYHEYIMPVLASIGNLRDERILTGYGSDSIFLGVTNFEGRKGSLEEIEKREYESTFWANEFIDYSPKSVSIFHPYWDNDLVDLALKIPCSHKIFKGYDKYVLRKAFDGLLPSEVVWRKKIGIHQSTNTTDFLSMALEIDSRLPELEKRKIKNYYSWKVLKLAIVEKASIEEIKVFLKSILANKNK